GRLIGVNIIDDALREVLRDTRSLNSRKKVLEENVTKLTNEIKSYDYLEDLKKVANSINNIKTKLDLFNLKLKKLNNIKGKLNELYKEKQSAIELINNLKNVDKLSNQITVVENKVLKHKYLSNYRV